MIPSLILLVISLWSPAWADAPAEVQMRDTRAITRILDPDLAAKVFHYRRLLKVPEERSIQDFGKNKKLWEEYLEGADREQQLNYTPMVDYESQTYSFAGKEYVYPDSWGPAEGGIVKPRTVNTKIEFCELVESLNTKTNQDLTLNTVLLFSSAPNPTFTPPTKYPVQAFIIELSAGMKKGPFCYVGKRMAWFVLNGALNCMNLCSQI